MRLHTVDSLSTTIIKQSLPDALTAFPTTDMTLKISMNLSSTRELMNKSNPSYVIEHRITL